MEHAAVQQGTRCTLTAAH